MHRPYYARLIVIFVITFLVGCQPGTFRSPKITEVAENPVEIPARIGYVNDHADMLSHAPKNRLETRLRVLNEQQNVEFIVVCVMTTGNRGLENYSMDIAKKWDFNPKSALEKEILTLIARGDRNYRTNVSIGLAEEFPDDVLDQLYEVMNEKFSKDNFDEGIEMFIESVIARIAKKEKFNPS